MCIISYTGLRWGEAVALSKSNVNIARRRVRVAKSATEVSGRLEWGTPKTHEARTVMLPAFLADRLEKHIEGLAADDLVFTAPSAATTNVRRVQPGQMTPLAASKMLAAAPAATVLFSLPDGAPDSG